VYVLELLPNVVHEPRFAKRNPGMTTDGKFFYIGTTLHLPTCRMVQHRRYAAGESAFECRCFTAGAVTRSFRNRGEGGRTRGSRYAGMYAKYLRGRIFAAHNPIGSEVQARLVANFLARKLRARGYGVWLHQGKNAPVVLQT
jgi:hypothetical protein